MCLIPLNFAVSYFAVSQIRLNKNTSLGPFNWRIFYFRGGFWDPTSAKSEWWMYSFWLLQLEVHEFCNQISLLGIISIISRSDFFNRQILKVIYTCIYICIYACMYVCMYVRVYIYIYIYIYIYTYTHTHTHIHIYVCRSIYIYICIYLCMCICMQEQ